MHLNCHSYFSFLHGTISIKELLHEAQRCGVTRLALTDINTTAGILDFVLQASKTNIVPVAGIDFRNGNAQQYIGIAKNQQGFHELNTFLTDCLSEGEPQIPKDAPECNNAFFIFPLHNFPQRSLRSNEFIGVRVQQIPKILFSPLKNSPEKLVLLAPVTLRSGICAQTGMDLRKRNFNMHRLLRAIGNNTLLTKLSATELSGEYEVMRTEEELVRESSLLPSLAQNAAALLAQCELRWQRGINRNKKFFTGNAQDDFELLRSECANGLQQRYKNPTQEVVERMKKELEDVQRLGYTGYFLISWDMVRYAKHRGFFHVGRGSGANSLLAYCLQITDVDPVELNLYFERFINPYRSSPPDFDLDFSWKDRDEIITYVFKKYGKDHTALLGAYNTFQSNALIRELGKVFGLPKAEIDELAENGIQHENKASITKTILTYSRYLQDFPHHLSIHTGGILISELPITYYSALSMPPKGFPVSQFSMLEAEDIGLHKFDVLSQRGLGHIRDTIEIVNKNRGENIDIRAIAQFKQDKKIAHLIREGKCMGCFYVESPAMRMLLKKLRCDDYVTLVAASSIIRPGVSQSGMMREYIQRFHNPVRMLNTPECLLDLLRETYGVMVFQEDVIRVAHHFAGLSLAEADVLRRGMSGKFRSREEFQKIRDNFFRNCHARGYSEELTAEVWRQIESFAGYSFSKGHSASYAVESYQSLFLKAHYPLEFMVGVINNFGGFYRTEYYVHEARMAGATIHPPCINQSEILTGIKGTDIFLGLGLIAELEQQLIADLLNERERNGNFLGLHDVAKRVRVSGTQLRLLIRVGAFRFTGQSKKELLWELLRIPGMSPGTSAKQLQTENSSSLFQEEFATELRLPELDHGAFDDVLDEIELLGFPLASPFSLLRNPLTHTLNAAQLGAHLGKIIEIAGYYVTSKPVRTVRGDHMFFGTFLDRDGYFFDTTHFPLVARQHPLRGKAVYSITGKVVEDFGFYSVDVIRVEKLPYGFGSF